MGLSIVGVRDLDKEFAIMAKVKEACEEAGVGYPKEVDDYFEKVCGYDAGENIGLLREESEEVELWESWDNDDCPPFMTEGDDFVEIDLEGVLKVHPDLKKLRIRCGK